MTYRKMTYIFLVLISIFTLIGITFFKVDATPGFIFIGAITTGYFIDKKWQKKKDIKK